MPARRFKPLKTLCGGSISSKSIARATLSPSSDKMGSGKDQSQRKRRKMTTGERVEQGKTRHGTESISNFFPKAPGNNDDGNAMDVEEEPANQSSNNDALEMDADDELLSDDPNDAAANEEKPSSNRVINDEGFSLRAVGVSNPSPIEPSIDDEGDDDGDDDGDDGVDFDDDEAGDDNERGRKRVRRKRKDFQ